MGRFGDATSQTYLAEVRQGHRVCPEFIDGNKATITDFYVDPDWRRKGVGTSMVRGTLARFDELGVEEVTLTVRRDTPTALTFWEAQGFMIGHYELKQFRDPSTGTAYHGALSSDFSE
ncbi:MAG: GNAT family N-acetyltransferase [Candidatus Latescibacterota bacterium]